MNYRLIQIQAFMLLFCCLIPKQHKAAGLTDDTIRLEIHLPDSIRQALPSKTIEVKLYTQFMDCRERVDGRLYKTDPDKEGNYRFLLIPPSEYCQVSIYPLLTTYGYKATKLYLLRRGDNLVISVDQNGQFSFSGKGAEKMRCQYALYEIDKRGIFQFGDPARDGRKPDFLITLQKKTDSVIRLKEATIRQYTLTPLEKAVLNVDAVAQTEKGIYASLKYALYDDQKNNEKFQANQVYYKNQYLHQPQYVPSEAVLRNSAAYTDALLARIKNDMLNSKIMNGSLDPKDKSQLLMQRLFLPMAKLIRTNYKGYAREKLLTTLFAQSFYASDSTNELLQASTRLVQDSHLKKILEEIAKTKLPNQPVYNFSLPDTKGRMVQLADFRGKVVLLDFWFTGCSNCVTMTTRLRKVADHYAKDTNVVFVNISVDKNRNEWLASLASGKYSHPNSINLYTEGNGSETPIIRKYNTLGYPRLMLISKKGDLISAEPPAPDNENGIQKLVNMIDKALH